MAKVGEGDARWIVEERADGANVNAWHWAERDVLPWAQRRLQELLGGKELHGGAGGATLRTGPGVEVSGEAITNNRKGKLIPSYELALKGTWTGEVQGQAGAGGWQLPYLADENADEDPEVKATAGDGAAAQRLREAFLAHGRPAVHAAVRTWVAEMKAGGPAAKGPDAPEAKPADAAARAATAKAAAESRAQLEAAKRAAAAREAAEAAAGTASVELTERYAARPADLRACFTEAQRVMAFTQAPAQAANGAVSSLKCSKHLPLLDRTGAVEPRVGGRFEIFGGAVRATFTELAPQRLALDWHFNSWREGVLSKVTITLEETSPGSTVLRLQHRGIPREDRFGGDALETARSGWRTQILHRIRAVFGYGL